MRIATWNVNSIRSRIDRVEAFLTRHEIDVIALQETKARDDQFPESVLTEHGHLMLANWLARCGDAGAVARSAGLAPVVGRATA